MNGSELTPCWGSTSGDQLEQGDLLPDCYYPNTFSPIANAPVKVDLRQDSLIVVTQSCDLVLGRVLPQVALCRLSSVEQMETDSPNPFKNKGFWEEVKKGRRLGLYLLQSPDDPLDTRKALVADFRQIISLPSDYVTQRASEVGARWRLTPPQREHFSQAFGFYFMRVAIATTLPNFG